MDAHALIDVPEIAECIDASADVPAASSAARSESAATTKNVAPYSV